MKDSSLSPKSNGKGRKSQEVHRLFSVVTIIVIDKQSRMPGQQYGEVLAGKQCSLAAVDKLHRGDKKKRIAHRGI